MMSHTRLERLRPMPKPPSKPWTQTQIMQASQTLSNSKRNNHSWTRIRTEMDKTMVQRPGTAETTCRSVTLRSLMWERFHHTVSTVHLLSRIKLRKLSGLLTPNQMLDLLFKRNQKMVKNNLLAILPHSSQLLVKWTPIQNLQLVLLDHPRPQKAPLNISHQALSSQTSQTPILGTHVQWVESILELN